MHLFAFLYAATLLMISYLANAFLSANHWFLIGFNECNKITINQLNHCDLVLRYIFTIYYNVFLYKFKLFLKNFKNKKTFHLSAELQQNR